MKQTFTFFTFIFASLVAFSQAPNAMSYQAVIRDANNDLVSNQSVGMQISILQGSASGSSVYTETQTASTNDNGLVSIAIGEGTTSDDFSSVDWANGPYFIKTETDPTGGSNYTITGTSQLLSVPYALYAKSAENTFSGDYNDLNNAPDLSNYDQDNSDDFDGDYNSLVNKPTLATVASTGDYNDLSNKPNIPTVPSNVSSFNNDAGYITTLNDDDATNELQNLSVSTTGDTLYLQNGGFVIIPGISAANTPPQLATLTTTAASSITDVSAISGGNISNDGGATITVRGIVWSTSQNPTLASNLGSTNDGSGTGSFTSNLTGLSASTTYYVRAYATNSAGTAYGNEVSFTTTAGGGGIVTNPGGGVTFDGYTYTSIVLGNGQEWMAENLRTTTYANGDPIPNVTAASQWGSTTTGAWVHYDNNSQYENPYGKLYNWYTVADPRNVCPTGWHVPTDAEYTLLSDYLGGEPVAGGKMKSTGTQYWISPNTDATNESGFSGLPGGYRLNGGPFGNIGNLGYWWSSSEDDAYTAWSRGLVYVNGSVFRVNENKDTGISVRCLRD